MKNIILKKFFLGPLIMLFTFCGSAFADMRAEFQAGFVTGDPEITFNGVSEDLDVDNGINLGGNIWWDGVASPNLSLGLSVNRTSQADFNVAVNQRFLDGVVQGVSLEHEIDTFMVNAIFRDNSAGKKMRPYVGGGIGMAKTDVDTVITGTITVSGVQFAATGTANDDDTSFAFQFMGGVDFEITENVYVGASFGYFMTEAEIFGADVDFDTFRGNLVLGVKF